MSPTAKAFVVASLVYLAVGVILGFAFTVGPARAFVSAGPGSILVGVHAHANLVGFVSMMIFGVGYHILPRFTGRPLMSERLATVQFWLANAGAVGAGVFNVLAVAVGTDFFRAGGGRVVTAEMTPYLAVGSVFSGILALSFLLFVYNIIKTVR